MPLERSVPTRLPPHRDAPARRWQNWARTQAKAGRPLAIDLFAGCGGLSLGLHDAGFEVVLAVDHDPFAIETHRHNLPGPALDLDLSQPERIDSLVGLLKDLPIDLVAGGPPCQPFSRAGRPKIRSLVEEGSRPAHDARSELWQAFLEVVERVKPRAVLLENVPDMALGEEVVILRIIVERLARLGYSTEARLLEAKDYGVPQHRQRLIVVGMRSGLTFDWPQPTQAPVTLRQAIGDLPKLRKTTGSPEMEAAPPRTKFQRHARRNLKGDRTLWDHVTRPVRDDDREAFRILKPGMRYGDLPDHLRRYRSDIFNDKYNRLAWDAVSRSITAHIAKDGYWYIHPSELRTLTVREAARIQTFPDDFRFAGSRSHAFRQIGNAVPPLLGEVVGAAILRSLRTRPGRVAGGVSDAIHWLREQLIGWAEDDSKAAPWRHPTDPWQATVGVVLGDRVGFEDREARSLLAEFPAIGSGVATQIQKRAESTDGPAGRRLLRLAAVARSLAASRGASRNESWLQALEPGPQEEDLLRVLALHEDKIIPTQQSVRVVGRFFGDPTLDERRLSDGRMQLGLVVGIESDPPRLNAALHALGRGVCLASDPICHACPLQSRCLHPTSRGV